jgi:hypothetical protein
VSTPTDRTVTVPLSDRACMAVVTPEANILTRRLTDTLIANIINTPIDKSLGEKLAHRHVVCTVAEAQDLFSFFRNAANKYGLGGNLDERVQICADAADKM